MYFSLVWRAEFLTLPVETIMSVIKKTKLLFILLFILLQKEKVKEKYWSIYITWKTYKLKNIIYMDILYVYRQYL